MKRLFSASICFLVILGATLTVHAQQGGGRDRGSRGDRGDRGGFGGGDMGRGGPPGGFGGGGFGGPPGGGFGGQPGGFGGGGFGGPPGGFGGGGFGGPPGGFGGGGGDRSSRFGSMMDSNGNGQIDQEEIDRMPPFVRDMMKSRGLELKAGMSLDDMRNSFRNGGQPGQPNAPGGNQPPNAAAAPKVLTPYKMKPRKPITLTLPPAYSDDDTDFDGQIGMYEWMMTRRMDLDQFDAMDTDYDGYLTPDELMAAETLASAQSEVASTERKRLVIVSATPVNVPGKTNSPSDNNRGRGQSNDRGSNPWASGDPNAMATSYFDRLDLNRDGSVDGDEWQQSRRVRGMFEQAGIRLDKMSRDQFTQAYVKLSANANSNSGQR